MAEINSVYLPGLIYIYSGSLSLTSADVRALLLNSDDYIFDNTDEFLSDIPSGARLCAAVALTGLVLSVGSGGVVWSCSSPITFIAPTDGETAAAMLLYDHSGGADSARRLIGYISIGYNFPLDLNGNNASIDIDATKGLWYTDPDG